VVRSLEIEMLLRNALKADVKTNIEIGERKAGGEVEDTRRLKARDFWRGVFSAALTKYAKPHSPGL
jgi:hypothetical protein